jgi:phytoene dehydrogenase-like protein
MESGSMIIIGAGVAGLSAGCYGRMNGFETTIFEMHDKPGGVCTSWKRKGYVFDGCIHWLVGSRPGSDFNRVWMELGALQGREIVDHEEFYRVEEPDGKTLVVYTDADRFERHMKELSPADARLIEKMMRDVRAMGKMVTPIGKPSGTVEGLRLALGTIPAIGPLMRWHGRTIRSLGAAFKDPFLREAFPRIFDLADFPMMAVLTTLAWLNSRDAGYPIGGSLEFARAIERRYLDLGGVINYKSRVEKVLVEGDHAVGVRLADGTEHRADTVISAADGHSTVFEMLDGRYTDEEIRGYYADLPLFEPLIQVSLGVFKDLSKEPHAVDFPLDEPLVAAGKVYRRITAQHYCFDPTLAPEGKSVVIVYLASDYDYWKVLSEDRKRYRAEKDEIANRVIKALDVRFPGLRESVEVVDVATPITTERYTGNWCASFEGWLLTTKTSKYTVKQMKRELPGLGDFFMIGQWLAPGGGLPPVALHGRQVIQTICTRRKKPFVTSVP